MAAKVNTPNQNLNTSSTTCRVTLGVGRKCCIRQNLLMGMMRKSKGAMFLCIYAVMWSPNRHTDCDLLWRAGDPILRFSVNLEHRVLSQRPVTRSPRPVFTLTVELFIKVGESTGDPANFSMGLLAVLTVRRALKRQTHKAALKWSVSRSAPYISEMDISRHPHN